MRAICSAKTLGLWLAALLLMVALTAAGGAFAQTAPGRGGANGGGDTNGGGRAASPAAPSISGGGGAVHTNNDPASCDVGLMLPEPPRFGDAADAVKDMSEATQAYIRNCNCATQLCIADALDQYAQALAEVAPRLPPHLQNAAGIVATAAARARVARTKKDAVRALQDAIAAIHKDVDLVKAEDPDNSGATRGGDFVAATLTVASLALEKGGGL